jgi:hypothetical protein
MDKNYCMVTAPATAPGHSLNYRVLEFVREVNFEVEELGDVRDQVKVSVARCMGRWQE